MSARAVTAGDDPISPIPGRLLRERLRRRLLALGYEDFARCVCRLLTALGYQGVRLSGRREWKGYNRPGGGGWDVEATLPGGIAPRRVVAQLKQFDALPVHQRQVDELRGACLRAGAAEALLITTSAFSQAVRTQAAATGAPVPPFASVPLIYPIPLISPVRLIDGEELTALMMRHRLGVQETGKGGARRLEIDEGFFRELAGVAAASKSHPIGQSPIGQGEARGLTHWRVTVRIFSGRCGTGKDGREKGLI